MGSITLKSPFSAINYLVQTSQILAIVFLLFFLVWLLYTIVATYHWVKYGHQSKLGVPALVTHVLVSVVLFAIAAGGFFFALPTL